MSVDYTNFVKININNHLITQVSGTRDTVILFNFLDSTTGEVEKVYSDISEYEGSTDAKLYNYLTTFFNNGGKKIRVIPIDASSATTYSSVISILKNSPFEQMMVSYCDSTTNSTIDEESFRLNVVEVYNKDLNKLYAKIFVCRIAVDSLNSYIESGAVKLENYVLKLGDPGIESTVLAYFSKINVYSVDATQDYMFTSEVVNNGNSDHNVFNDNEVVKTIIDNNYNVDSLLANSIRNIGGNDTSGRDLINQFMLLMVHQTITERLIQLLVNKLKYNSYGVSSIINTVSQELDNYLTNGYLMPNKIWTDPDLYYRGYKIIDKNTALVNGYKVVVLPFSSLSQEELNSHQLPEIYILLADSYGIRKISITGEVF